MIKRVLMVVLFALVLSGCSNWIDHSLPKTEIEAFYYHERGRYSAAVLDGGIIKMMRIHAAIITLDSKGKPWYWCDYQYNSWSGPPRGACYVHLRDVNDINTSGWNHGKFGSGTTTRIN